MTINAENKAFTKPDKAVELRIEKLLSRLSLEDKIELIGGDPEVQATKSNKKAGFPQIRVSDGPMGVHWWCDYSTAYPATICAAASWDRGLVKRMGKGLARDAKARGIHIVLGPGVNIYRAPYCGRNFEYMGEDPYLVSRMGLEFIRGVQSMGVGATVKHYALNYQEFHRRGVSSDVDERTLHEIYLPAFRAAVQEAGVASVMTAYNPVNGVTCSEQHMLITEVLKKLWGFDGIVMSDWFSTYNAEGPANAGMDLEMPRAVHMNAEKLMPLIRRGVVSKELINDKVRRLFRVAVCFGWLDNEQKDKSIPLNDPETDAIALDLARGGIVLLKNDDILPVKQTVNKLAVVGGHSTRASFSGGGSACPTPHHYVSLLEGITGTAPNDCEIISAPGIDFDRCISAFDNTVFETENGERGLTGEYFRNPDFEGEPIMVRTDTQLNFDWHTVPPHPDLDVWQYSVRWRGYISPATSGRHMFYVKCIATEDKYTLTIDGKTPEEFDEPFGFNREIGTLVLEAGRAYKIELELRKLKYYSTFNFGCEHEAAILEEREKMREAARTADAVIACVGFTPDTEGERRDRTFALPKIQEDLLIEAADLNPNTIAVITAGGGVDMRKWIDKVKGVLTVWYPGQEGGTALGEILFGKANPSGKLPVTFERAPEDRAEFSNYHDDIGSGHVELKEGIFGGYRHFDATNTEPLFPFGFGLSYTDFEYSNLRLSADKITDTNGVTVSFDIHNIGKSPGAEIAQVYVRDIESRLPRPVKELKGFTKVMVLPGEPVKVSISLAPQAFVFYDPQLHDWVLEPGEFDILVGASATDIRLRARITAEAHIPVEAVA